MLSTHTEQTAHVRAEGREGVGIMQLAVAARYEGSLTARAVLFLKQQLGTLLPTCKGRHTDG